MIGGCTDREGGKKFVSDGLDEGFDVWGVGVVQFGEFVKIDLVGALTTKNDASPTSTTAKSAEGG